jgi:uncharacterized protein involved in outer membrane biogenesis
VIQTWNAKHPITRRVVWVLGSLLALVAILLIVLSLLSDATWKHLLEKVVSAKTNRDAKIGGEVHVRVWRRNPEITMEGFTLANATWLPDKPMLSVKHFEATVTWGSILRFNRFPPAF